MRHHIGYSSNGIAVNVDLIRSEAAKHISREPHLLGLIVEVLQKTKLKGPEIAIEHDMGRTIGHDFIVPTQPTDNVFYAQLLHDNIYTRFVKNGKPSTTSCLAMRLHRDETGEEYQLDDVWIGRLTPPRPGSASETAESTDYWSTHAVVQGNQPMQLRTVTKVCPYQTN
jgi:hypothetical protein